MPVARRVKFAVICASNQNRSMEAHNVLFRNRFQIDSYGTGKEVRLPGPTASQPNIYPFQTPYEKIYQELKAQNENLYRANGILAILERNKRVKKAPERWHDELGRRYDVVFTCEERCFDAVCEDLLMRGEKLNMPVHVINVDIRDNLEDATIGGRWILQLAQMIEAAEDLDAQIETILEEFRRRNPSTPILYNLCYY